MVAQEQGKMNGSSTTVKQNYSNGNGNGKQVQGSRFEQESSSKSMSGKDQAKMTTSAWLWQRFVCYGLLTLITLNGILHFCYGVIAFPIKLVSPTAFRKFCTFFLYLSVPGFLCVPFSWVNTRLFCNNLGTIKKYKGKNLLILANHSARVDWVLGLFIGSAYGERVTFVTEAFIMFLPFIGWFRYCVEDMFVFRSFKRDKERLEKNIMDFHESGVTRWVFLAPEGHIADFNPTDKQYIRDCAKFCTDHGLQPYEMVLTPRYKGLQCFNKLVTKGLNNAPAVDLSVAMTYVQDGDRLVKPLSSEKRVIPDLWSIVKGGLDCYVHMHLLEMNGEPEKMRTEMLNDYALKDKLLKHFYLYGRYPDGHPDLPKDKCPEKWKPLLDEDRPVVRRKPDSELFTLDAKQEGLRNFPKTEPWAEHDYFQQILPNHLAMNLSFFGQNFLALYVMNFLGLTWFIPYFVVVVYVLLAISHLAGEYLANGQSRESLPFEGVTKALMFRAKGIEGAQAEEKLQERVSVNEPTDDEPTVPYPEGTRNLM